VFQESRRLLLAAEAAEKDARDHFDSLVCREKEEDFPDGEACVQMLQEVGIVNP
jgi:hypothetical protein